MSAKEAQAQILRIAKKLNDLKDMDTDLSIWGASRHRYQVNPKKTEEELKSFEEEHQILLPTGYRLFLLQIGNGGAGPDYGMQSLERARLADLDAPDPTNLIHLSQKFIHTEFWDTDLDIAKDSRYDHLRGISYLDTRWMSGAIRIGNFGCGLFINLVINGEEYGNVWVDDRQNGSGIFPEPEPETTDRVTFLDWYETWLDDSIAEVGS